jgi:hypothetical protein
MSNPLDTWYITATCARQLDALLLLKQVAFSAPAKGEMSTTTFKADPALILFSYWWTLQQTAKEIGHK